MIGRSALWVARQHGHSIATMLRVYAAWTEGAGEGDLEAIKRAMAAPSNLSRSVPAPRERDGFPDRDLALDLSLARMAHQLGSGNQTRLMAEREGFEIRQISKLRIRKMIPSPTIPRNPLSCH
jgi:hypothetical protein